MILIDKRCFKLLSTWNFKPCALQAAGPADPPQPEFCKNKYWYYKFMCCRPSKCLCWMKRSSVLFSKAAAFLLASHRLVPQRRCDSPACWAGGRQNWQKQVQKSVLLLLVSIPSLSGWFVCILFRAKFTPEGSTGLEGHLSLPKCFGPIESMVPENIFTMVETWVEQERTISSVWSQRSVIKTLLIPLMNETIRVTYLPSCCQFQGLSTFLTCTGQYHYMYLEVG